MKEDNSDKSIQQLCKELTFISKAESHSKIHYGKNANEYEIVNSNIDQKAKAESIIDKTESKSCINAEQRNNFNESVFYFENRLVNKLAFIKKDKSFNDVLFEYDLQKKRKWHDQKNDVLLENNIPFIDKQFDAGDWTYRNRKELIISMLIYLLTITVIYFVKFDIPIAKVISGVYIDVPSSEEEIVKPEIIESEKYEINSPQEKIENTLINENVELEHDLNSQSKNESDNDPTEDFNSEFIDELDLYDENESELYQDAMKTQLELEMNKDAYENDLDKIDDIVIDENNDALTKRGLTAHLTDASQEAKNKNVSKVGNVTVSYSLKNRNVVKPNIPAYRCKGAGKIVVEITVGRDGLVTDANIKAMSRIDDQCLPQMAISAALNTCFNIDKYGPSKQTGLITFVFVAQ